MKVLEYIENHFKTYTLKQTAAFFGYNPVYLSNKLKKQFGFSFQNLISQKKYNLALELIQETDHSLEEIAIQLVYKNTSSLFKLFKKSSDKTPNEFRTSNRN